MLTRICLLASAVLSFTVALNAAAQTTSPPRPLAGQSLTYNEINGYNGLQRATIVRDIATAGNETHIRTTNIEGKILDDARLAGSTFLEGALNDRSVGRVTPGLELRPQNLEPGHRWTQHTRRDDALWKESRPVRVDGVVRGWETVRVPAGEFKAIKIERRMYLGDWDPFRHETHRHEQEWYSPELGMPIKMIVREDFRDLRSILRWHPGDWFIHELVSIKRAGASGESPTAPAAVPAAAPN